MAKYVGRHRAAKAARSVPALPVAGGAGAVAAAGAVILALTPALQTAPVLTAATVYYLRGTNIGSEPTDEQYRAFIGQVLAGTGIPANPPTAADQVVYNAGFWPVSHGGFEDLTWNASVAQGVQNLEAADPDGDVVFGFSQGAVVASQYKAAHPEGTGNTFVLVENPSRPNGGVLARFPGLTIPILDVTFSGATPDTGDPTVDIVRQYDGWGDFPTYPLNLLATANAVLGIGYVHGSTQTELTAADLAAAEAAGDGSMYYQTHGDTTYYLIPTERLPLLMPFTGIVPEPILDALDPPLRVLVETGYDRTDYSQPTAAKPIPPINPGKLAEDLGDATVAGITAGLADAGVTVPAAPAAVAGTSGGSTGKHWRTTEDPQDTGTAPTAGPAALPGRSAQGKRFAPKPAVSPAAARKPGKRLPGLESVTRSLRPPAPRPLKPVTKPAPRPGGQDTAADDR